MADETITLEVVWRGASINEKGSTGETRVATEGNLRN
jgi:hypothetical protein